MNHKVRALVQVEKYGLFGKKKVFEERTITVDGETYKKRSSTTPGAYSASGRSSARFRTTSGAGLTERRCSASGAGGERRCGAGGGIITINHGAAYPAPCSVSMIRLGERAAFPDALVVLGRITAGAAGNILAAAHPLRHRRRLGKAHRRHPRYPREGHALRAHRRPERAGERIALEKRSPFLTKRQLLKKPLTNSSGRARITPTI